MIRNEIGKLVVNPYLWGVMLVCVVLNLFLLSYGNSENYPANQYKDLWQDFLSGNRDIPEEIKIMEDKVEQSRNSEREEKEELYTQFLRELRAAETYGDYRQGILDNAQKMRAISIFSKKGFAQKNIEKTEKHFKTMGPVKVEAAPSLGVEKLFSMITAVLEVIFLLFLGYLLFIKENENGIRKFLYVTRYGNRRLFIAKISTHIIGVIVATVTMYSCNYMVLGAKYSFGNLSRSIQSVLAYRSCGYQISVREYFCLGILLLMFLFCILVLVVDFICIWGKRAVFSILLFLLCGLLSILLYVKIPINSALNCIKYLDMAFCLDVGEILGKYVNVNIFGIPVTYIFVLFTFYGLLGILCFLMALNRFCQPPLQESHLFKKVICLRKSYKRVKKQELCGHMSLFRYELFKVRKGGHILLVFLFFFVLSEVFSYQERLIFDDEDEYYYYYYMEKLSGERTPEKIAYIEQEKERFQKNIEKQEKLLQEEKTEELIMLGESMRPYQGFKRAEEREQYLRQNKFNDYIYEGGYVKLVDLKQNAENRILIIIGMLLLTFSLCGVFSLDKENGWQMLLETTHFGKKRLLRKKLLVAAFICVCSFCIIYLPQLYTFYRLYGFERAGGQIGCIQLQGFFPPETPIWCWLICQYGLRFFIMAVYSCIVLLVSNKLKNTFTAIIVLSLLIMVTCVVFF